MSDERRDSTSPAGERRAAAEGDEPEPRSEDGATEGGEPGGATTQKREGLDRLARMLSKGGATTLFQPGVMVRSILEETGEGVGDDTQALGGTPQPPPLPAGVEPYLLVLGAPPGRERIVLEAARTTFGRDRGDVRLDDASVSSLHFQIDVVGHEFFVRDLGSRNGTLLNGHAVRYSELLPGDELRIGETVLVFRVTGDGLSPRGETMATES